MSAWPDRVTEAWAALQDALFLHAVEPALQALGLAAYIEDAYLATQWLLVGALQVAAIACVLRPLERWRPFEAAPAGTAARRERRQALRVDVIYTLLDRLGLLRLALFFGVEPWWNALFGRLAVAGVDGWHLDQWIAPAWPGVSDSALAGFLSYAIALDLANYAIHRSQHRWRWWWALHAVHHSQRHMTAWTDSRNHLLDSLLVDTVLVLLARAIGVAPAQFVGLVALSKMVESLAHANLDLPFGRWGERLLVGPRFHRVHHGIGVGHEPAGGRGPLGCNFAVLLPLWDLLFGSARFDLAPGPTGIRDQLPEAGARDYGRGFWRQQLLALQRLGRAWRDAAR